MLVVAGGMVGTAIRAALESAMPAAPGHWPWATFLINITGAFVLGSLLEALVRTGRDEGWRRGVRLTAGTGLLGGYTTYSTFSVEVVQVSRDGALLIGPMYALASVALGLAAAGLGYRVAVALTPRPGPPAAAGGTS
jgi:CrcB protein